MRPIKLTISAFCSYADKTQIDFTQLGTSGIYLIAGDTGAGKTTIFDAICYALYGAASSDERRDQMLRSSYAKPTTPTYVELTFLYRGRTYTVTRNPAYERPRLKGSGMTKELAGATLCLPNETQVITGRSNVNAAIQTLLGITREEFRQIAMIAQGEFQRVLFTPTNKRTDIFRELFQTGHYQRLEQRIREDYRRHTEALQQAEQTLQKTVADIRFSEKQTEIQAVIEARSWHAGVQEIEELIAHVQHLLHEDAAERASTEQALQDLQNEADQIRLLIQTGEQQEKLQQECTQYKTALREEKAALTAAEARVRSAEQRFAEAQALGKEATLLAAQLEQYDRLEEMQREMTDLQDTLSQTEEGIRKGAAALEKHRTVLDTKKQALAELNEAALDLEKVQHSLAENQHMQEEMQTLLDLIARQKTQHQAYLQQQADYLKKREQYSEIEQHYAAQHALFLDAQAGILAQRLQPEQPCPVCGSLSHPRPALHRAQSVSAQSLQALKKKCDAAAEAVQESSAQAGQLRGTAEALLDEVRQKAQLPEKWTPEDLPALEAQIQSKQIALLGSRAELEREEKACKRRVEQERTLRTELPTLEKRIQDSELSSRQLQLEQTRLEEKKAGLAAQIKHLHGQLQYPGKKAAAEALQQLGQKREAIEQAAQKAQEDCRQHQQAVTTLSAKIEQLMCQMQGEEKVDLSIQRSRLQAIQNAQQKSRLAYDETNYRIRQNTTLLEALHRQKRDAVRNQAQNEMLQPLAKTVAGELIGKDKINLETYVQTAFFEKILQKANQRLQVMSGGQYALIRAENVGGNSKSGLDIDVLDCYIGERRDAHSLSGGEKFMASLSLALGLSDEIQASAGGISLDTMFIDEGFGSLSGTALQDALRVLQELSDANRLIGIISHVDALKQRIARQIIVTKENGESHIMIEA